MVSPPRLKRIFWQATISLLTVICASLPGHVTLAKVSKPARVVATDYPDLQQAVDALRDQTGELYIPAGTYVLTKTLDLTQPPGYRGGIKILGEGRMTKIIGKTKGQPVIDLTGANHCLIQDLNIEAETSQVTPQDAPNIGLLLARNREGGAAQEHRFSNLIINGYFTLANVYNITSELDRFIGCIFINRAPGAHNFVWSSDNFAHVKSPYRGELRTLYSNTELRIIGCSFYNWGGGEGGSNLHMRGFTMDTTVRDCYMNPPKGGYAVYLGTSSRGGPVRNAVFDSIRIEGENGADIFHIEGKAELITIRNSTIMYGRGYAVNADRLKYLNFEENDVWNMCGWKTAMQIGQLSDSRVTGNVFTFDNWGDRNTQAGPARVISGGESTRNTIQVMDRDLVAFESLQSTIIEALNDKGKRRRYLGDFASGETLNLTPVNTANLKHMKTGDIALDDGTNTASGNAGLAVFDGSQWIYMN